MLSIVTFGLILDFVGVALLGGDLVRVQHGLKNQSRRDVQALKRISDEYGGLSSWLDEISKSGDWRISHYEEGRLEFYDGFDSRAAECAFRDLSMATQANQGFAASVADLVTTQVQSAEQASRKSLGWSYLGIILIVTGFGLQIYGSL